MTINKLFPSESALSKYPIKRPNIILEKRLILAWRVTYIYIYIYIYDIHIFIHSIKHTVCLTNVSEAKICLISVSPFNHRILIGSQMISTYYIRCDRVNIAYN